jgi:hypothetical protein
MDQSNLLENLISLLNEQGSGPLVSLDLALAVAVNQLEQAKAPFEPHFDLKRFPHS